MYIKSLTPEDLKPEPAYNTTAARFFPWAGVPDPAWGGAWCAVSPGQAVTAHLHDEKEIFFIVEGTGEMRIGDSTRAVSFGDTIFITPDVEHDLTNTGPGRLLFISIWWDGTEPASQPAT